MCNYDEAFIYKNKFFDNEFIALRIECPKCRLMQEIRLHASVEPVEEELAEQHLIKNFTYEHQRNNKESMGNDLSRKNPMGQTDRRYPPGMGKVRYDDY